MPPVKSKTVQESRPPMNRNPKKQNSTSCASVKKHGRLEKQASINESDKLVDRNKRPKTECSLEVPVSSARRYSLPTAQIIEEAKENAYLKKAQKYGCNSDSRRGSQALLSNRQLNSNYSSRRGSRCVDTKHGSKGELNGGTTTPTGLLSNQTLLVPSTAGRRLSSPNLAPMSNSSSSRRGSFVATLGLGELSQSSAGSRRNSAVGPTFNSGSTGLLGGLSSALATGSTSNQQTKSSEPALGFLPSIGIGGGGGGGKKGGNEGGKGMFSSWMTGSKTQSNASQNLQSGMGGSLSYRSRLQAYAVCLVAGMIVEVLGGASMFVEVNKRTQLLFLLFTLLGNLAMVCSTTFLASFAIQKRQLMEETRLISGLIYFLALFLCSAVALVLKNPPLVMLAIFAKDFSITWYSLTYIPVVRSAMRQCLAA
ncbi:uncharacterized protein LOC134846647 [Symsagittifera roscoffensis]|uniref:uncharacterized protein LOC134846647 n=1 Tax=Symsagittifera roscoffensis TaxID=84072 RepID=UPI00307BAD4E